MVAAQLLLLKSSLKGVSERLRSLGDIRKKAVGMSGILMNPISIRVGMSHSTSVLSDPLYSLQLQLKFMSWLLKTLTTVDPCDNREKKSRSSQNLFNHIFIFMDI